MIRNRKAAGMIMAFFIAPPCRNIIILAGANQRFNGEITAFVRCPEEIMEKGEKTGKRRQVFSRTAPCHLTEYLSNSKYITGRVFRSVEIAFAV
jgi:hypothetical protein